MHLHACAREAQSLVAGRRANPLSRSVGTATWPARISSRSRRWSLRARRSTTSTPFSCSQLMPPSKLTDSPTTTLLIPNWRISPTSVPAWRQRCHHHGVAVAALAASAVESVDLGVHRNTRLRVECSESLGEGRARVRGWKRLCDCDKVGPGAPIEAHEALSQVPESHLGLSGTGPSPIPGLVGSPSSREHVEHSGPCRSPLFFEARQSGSLSRCGGNATGLYQCRAGCRPSFQVSRHGARVAMVLCNCRAGQVSCSRRPCSGQTTTSADVGSRARQ